MYRTGTVYDVSPVAGNWRLDLQWADRLRKSIAKKNPKEV